MHSEPKHGWSMVDAQRDPAMAAMTVRALERVSDRVTGSWGSRSEITPAHTDSQRRTRISSMGSISLRTRCIDSGHSLLKIHILCRLRGACTASLRPSEQRPEDQFPPRPCFAKRNVWGFRLRLAVISLLFVVIAVDYPTITALIFRGGWGP